jgi:hypothetical protein
MDYMSEEKDKEKEKGEKDDKEEKKGINVNKLLYSYPLGTKLKKGTGKK